MSVDLRCSYLGFVLRNPLVVAASPLTTQLHMLERLQEAGAAAAVMGSLFAEQIEFERAECPGASWFDSRSRAASLWAHDLDEYNSGVDCYLERIAAAKDAVDIPIIASLNATTYGDWVDCARLIEQVGADALELNIYFVPTDPELSSDAVEDRYIELVAAVRSQIKIPLAVKIGPYFSSLPHMARRLSAAGADGLVLFNRFLQPDIDLDGPSVASKLVLSTRDEMRLPLRWIGILRGQTNLSLAASTGVHTAEDVLKMILAGADVTMLASALLQHGPGHLSVLLDQMTAWLQQQGCFALHEIHGVLSQHRCANPGEFERANYAQALATFAGSEQAR